MAAMTYNPQENKYDIAMREEKISSSSGESFWNQMRQKWNQIATKMSKFGERKILTHGVTRLSTMNEVLLVGPPRVGKSTLITALTGVALDTSPSTLSCTRESVKISTSTLDFWDTPGIESWDEKTAEMFWEDTFIKKRILPLAMLVCVSPGCFMDYNSPGFTKLKDCSLRYDIPMIFVICNSMRADDDWFEGFIRDVELITGQNVSVRNGIVHHVRGMKSWVIEVNSIPFRRLGKVRGVFGLNRLMRCIYQSQTSATKKNLLRMHKDNATMMSRVGSWLFDFAYELGVPTQRLLDEEERALYTEMAGRPIMSRDDMIRVLNVFGVMAGE